MYVCSTIKHIKRTQQQKENFKYNAVSDRNWMFIFTMSGYYKICEINIIQTSYHAEAVQESENELVTMTSI